MKTVGEILSEERRKRKISLSAVVGATKIRRCFIKAIEKNDFSSFFSSSMAYGFIKNYAQFLGLSSRFVLAVFRRDFCRDKKGRIIPRGLVEPLDKPKIFDLPRIGLFLVTVIFVLGIVFYLFFQYLSLVRGPFLEVMRPKDQEEITLPFVEVVGKTEPDASVMVGGELVSLSPAGEFSLRVDLLNGKNMIVIESTNKMGKSKKIIREVFQK